MVAHSPLRFIFWKKWNKRNQRSRKPKHEEMFSDFSICILVYWKPKESSVQTAFSFIFLFFFFFGIQNFDSWAWMVQKSFIRKNCKHYRKVQNNVVFKSLVWQSLSTWFTKFRQNASATLLYKSCWTWT